MDYFPLVVPQQSSVGKMMAIATFTHSPQKPEQRLEKPAETLKSLQT